MFFLGNKKQKIYNKLSKDPDYPFRIIDVFTDPNFAEVIKRELSAKSTKDKIKLKDLKNIKMIQANNQNIQSLEGLEYLDNLIYADFSDNRIESLPDFNELGFPPKNNDTLLFLNLEKNPVSETNFLLGIEGLSLKQNFFQFYDKASSRFNLGIDRFLPESYLHPILLQIAIEKYLPHQQGIDRTQKINEIIKKFIVAKKIFKDQDIYKDQYLERDGQIEFSQNVLNSPVFNEETSQVATELIDSILTKEDLYMILSLIHQDLNTIDEKTIPEMLVAYKNEPEKLSKDYVLVNGAYTEAQNYKKLKEVGIKQEQEALRNRILSKDIKNLYNKYLYYQSIINDYKEENPGKAFDIEKINTKADQFIENFLNQYIALEGNELLTDVQRRSLAEAAPALNKYIEQYKSQMQDLFDQDVFNFEVEMRYIDMLSEGTRSMNNFTIG